MHKGLNRKLQEFLEAEKKAPIDDALLEQLWAYTAMPTLYWELPPEVRNTLNKFYRGMVDDIIDNMTTGKYGAQVVLESAIVVAFEAGLRYGSEKEVGKDEESKGTSDGKDMIPNRQP